MIDALALGLLTAVVAAVLGYSRQGASRLDPWLAIPVVASVVMSVLLLMNADDRADGGSDSAYFRAIALAVAFQGLLLPIAFYALGRAVGARSGLLTLTLAALAVPLILSLFYLWVFVADLAWCEPDQYECPL